MDGWENLEGQMSIFDFLPHEESKKKILKVDVRGIMDDGYCPECNYNLDDLVEKCPICGNLLDWSSWKILNK